MLWALFFTFFLKRLIFTRVDKNNITVILNRNNHLSKMEILLSDTSTYEMIQTDPIKRLTNDLKTLLRWKIQDGRMKSSMLAPIEN